MPWWIPVLLGGLFTALFGVMGKLIYDGIKDKQEAKPVYRNGVGAGERSVEFWQSQFREIIEDVMEHRNLTIEKIIREVIRDEFRKEKL